MAEPAISLCASQRACPSRNSGSFRYVYEAYSLTSAGTTSPQLFAPANLTRPHACCCWMISSCPGIRRPPCRRPCIVTNATRSVALRLSEPSLNLKGRPCLASPAFVAVKRHFCAPHCNDAGAPWSSSLCATKSLNGCVPFLASLYLQVELPGPAGDKNDFETLCRLVGKVAARPA